MGYLFFERRDSDEAAAKLVKPRSVPYTTNCYYGIQLRYNGKSMDDYFYFGFYASPIIEKAIEEFNSKFKNIRVVIVKHDVVKFTGSLSYLPGDLDVHDYYMFRIELSDKYKQRANYWLNLAIAQFFRIFCPEYDFYSDAVEIKDDYIRNMLRVFNNKPYSYGNWDGGTETSYQLFFRLDDVDDVNRVSKRVDLSGMPETSNILPYLE